MFSLCRTLGSIYEEIKKNTIRSQASRIRQWITADESQTDNKMEGEELEKGG